MYAPRVAIGTVRAQNTRIFFIVAKLISFAAPLWLEDDVVSRRSDSSSSWCYWLR